jgi:hypothetical protein
LFSTSWDTEADAVEFEQAISHTTRCWANDVGLGRAVFAGAPRILRVGSNVSLVRGLSELIAKQALLRLVSLPMERRAASAPFGPVEIPPIRLLPQLRPDAIQSGAYFSERLGISAPAPPGFFAKLDEGVTFSRDQPSVVLQIKLAGPQGWTTTPLGPGLSRSWHVDTGAKLRLLVVPICRNTGALVFTEVWADAEGRAQLDWWLSAIRPLAAGEPPICAELDP